MCSQQCQIQQREMEKAIRFWIWITLGKLFQNTFSDFGDNSQITQGNLGRPRERGKEVTTTTSHEVDDLKSKAEP